MIIIIMKLWVFGVMELNMRTAVQFFKMLPYWVLQVIALAAEWISI